MGESLSRNSSSACKRHRDKERERERERERDLYVGNFGKRLKSTHTHKPSSDVLMPFLDFKERKKSHMLGNWNLSSEISAHCSKETHKTKARELETCDLNVCVLQGLMWGLERAGLTFSIQTFIIAASRQQTSPSTTALWSGRPLGDLTAGTVAIWLQTLTSNRVCQDMALTFDLMTTSSRSPVVTGAKHWTRGSVSSSRRSCCCSESL